MQSRLNSRPLGLFLAVAEALSFRQAAEMLHLSQPPLSRAIRELEELLGTRLFDRSTQGVSLTDAGRKLMPYARSVGKLLREAEASLSEEGQEGLPPTLRFGVTNAIEPKWFSRLAERIRSKLPESTVSMVVDSSPRLARQVRTGRLAAAFIALPTHTFELEVAELDRLPMMLAIPTSHRLAKIRRMIRLSDLSSETIFWFERARQPAFYDHCQRIFAKHGFAPQTLKEPADHHVLLAEVAAGRGIALLPESFTGLRRSGVSYRALVEGDELAVAIGLVSLKNKKVLRDLLIASVQPGAMRDHNHSVP